MLEIVLSFRKSLVGKTAFMPALPGHIVCDMMNVPSRKTCDVKGMPGAKQNPTQPRSSGKASQRQQHLKDVLNDKINHQSKKKMEMAEEIASTETGGKMSMPQLRS